MNKNIRNNLILKQNSSQAPHIRHGNQNLEDKHCMWIQMRRLIMTCHIWICSLHNHPLFYLVLKWLKTCIRFYLLNLRCHYYVCACNYYKIYRACLLIKFVLNFHCILYSTHSTHEYFSKVLSTYLSTFTKCVLSTYSSSFKTVSTQYLLEYFF